MALSNAERQKAYRARQKAAADPPVARPARPRRRAEPIVWEDQIFLPPGEAGERIAKRIRELEDEVHRLKQELALRPPPDPGAPFRPTVQPTTTWPTVQPTTTHQFGQPHPAPKPSASAAGAARASSPSPARTSRRGLTS